MRTTPLRWIAAAAALAVLVTLAVAAILPSLAGWPGALVLVGAMFAALLAIVVAVGGVAIAVAAAVFGLAIVGLVVAVLLLLVASPVLLIGGLVWRLTARPRPAARGVVPTRA
jgi:hypothetical protein